MTAATHAWSTPLTIGVVGGALMFVLASRTNAHAHGHALGDAHGDARPPATAAAGTVAPFALHVPRAREAITIDGELAEADWIRAPARTGAFVAEDGSPARPFSEARALWDDHSLYLALYAADEDIEPAKVPSDGPVWIGDAFRMVFTAADGSARTIDVGADGTVTDAIVGRQRAPDYHWQSHAVVAVDVDGTPSDARDRDEEWVVEMAIPLASLGLTGRAGEHIGLEIKRCDEVAGARVCGAWGARATASLVIE